MNHQTKLGDIKAEIRSLIISSPVGLTVNKFIKDYGSSIGRSLPYKEFGFKTATEFLRSLKDVVKIEYTERGPILVAVRNEQVAHVNDLVQHQKKQRGTNHTRIAPQRPDMITIPRLLDVPCSVPKTDPKVNNTIESQKTDNNKTTESYGINEKQSQKTDLGNNLNLSDVEMMNDIISCGIPQDSINNDCSRNKEDKKGEFVVATNSSTLNEMARSKSPTGSFGCDKVSEKMKENFRQILQEHSRGISASKLCAAYKEKFGYPLVINDLGYDSLRELILSLPNVFNFEKTKFSNDWILYDARMNPKKKISCNDGGPSKWIPNSVLDNIANLAKKHPDGIIVDDVLELYEKEYHVRIDVKKLGYENVGSFLSNCFGIQFRSFDNVDYIVPKSKKKTLHDDTEPSDALNALPPYKDMIHLWKEYFRDEVCDPANTYKEFVFIDSEQFRTKVADVHSPDYVYLQPVDYGVRLSSLMLELNTFYDDVESQYVMPINVMKPGLVCCAKFSIDNTWYRAKINNISASGFCIFYVDYGTVVSDVKPSEIRFLHKKFLADPIQTIRSRLYNLIPTNGKKNWPMETNVYLFNLLHQNIFYANVVAIDKDYPMLDVMLIDTSGSEDVNISDLLMKENLATSAALEDVWANKNENVCDHCNKKDWLDLVPEPFLKALYKVLPVWLIDNPFHDIDGIRNELRAMERFLKNGVSFSDLVCCPSHMTRTMFYSDPEEISNLWREILVQNNHNFIKVLTKRIASLSSFEIRCQQPHPSFCNRYVLRNTDKVEPRTSNTHSSEADVSHTLESSITVKEVDKVPEKKKNIEADDTNPRLIFPKEKDVTQLADIKTKERRIRKSSELLNNTNKSYNMEDNAAKIMERSTDFINSIRKSENRYENNHKASSSNHMTSSSNHMTSSSNLTPNQSMSHIFSKRSLGPPVRELQITEQKGEGKFVFEMELAPGLVLILVRIINVLYVVKEQIIRDFARGTPSVLTQHRSNKLIHDPENIIIDASSHPTIYRNLKYCGLTRGDRALLIPLDNAGNLLRTLIPQEKNIALAFDKLAHQYKCDLRILIDDNEEEA